MGAISNARNIALKDENAIEEVPNKDLKQFLKHVTVWIPGEAMAIYAVAVALLLANDVAVWVDWLVLGLIGVGLTTLLTVAAIWTVGTSLTAEKKKQLKFGTIMAILAFAIWSFAMVGSAWWNITGLDEWAFGLIAAGAGIAFGAIATISGIKPPN